MERHGSTVALQPMQKQTNIERLLVDQLQTSTSTSPELALKTVNN